MDGSNQLTYVTDYNECQNAGMCHHGRCINMDGTYRCVCNTGYMLSEDKRACVGTSSLKDSSTILVATWAMAYHDIFVLMRMEQYYRVRINTKGGSVTAAFLGQGLRW